MQENNRVSVSDIIVDQTCTVRISASKHLKSVSDIIVGKTLQEKENHFSIKDSKMQFENICFEQFGIDGDVLMINGQAVPSYKTNLKQYGIGLDLIFINCVFADDISFLRINQNVKFEKCSFGKIHFKNLLPGKEDNYSILIEQCKLSEIVIDNCRFPGKFYVNPQYRDANNKVLDIDSVSIRDTVFEHNFKLHNCKVKKIDINNTDFEKNADFFKSKFLQKNQDINFKSINFNALSLFGECEFHSKFILEYVTFRGLTHFRESKFLDGFNLDKSNIEKEMNFYGVKGLEATENISQETYRIIKYNCQKIGNNIEANKYHSLELFKRREYVNKNFKENKLDWFVFNINWFSSKFSTNWILALFWIFVTSVLTYLAIDSFICSRHGCSDSWMDTFKYMSIVNLDECIKKNSLIFILNKSSLGYLYYQFITAVRKDTKK